MTKGSKPKVALANEGTDEKHHKYRCRDLRRQLEELEEYNDTLAVKLQQAHKRLKRMKVERNILLDRFEHTRQYGKHESSDSDAPLKDTFPRHASDMDEATRARRKPHSSTASTPQASISANGEAAHVSRKPRGRDPNAPKRPANAFVLYCQVERPNIKSAGTELTSSELTRSMGVKWRGLPKSEKQAYFDLYEREMARYQREMDTYKGVTVEQSSPVAMDVDEDETQPPTANGEPVHSPESATPTTATERDGLSLAKSHSPGIAPAEPNRSSPGVALAEPNRSNSGVTLAERKLSKSDVVSAEPTRPSPPANHTMTTPSTEPTLIGPS
ncbi:non-histone protein [Coemansia sp. RSA 1752]|nr:non-histone protein [Coemansia sp. RSA 1752]KAJ2256252.1 non-histone protein [Coemansia sp. RSA 454]